MPHDEPPADPNDWTDEQWIEWLKATDADSDRAHPPATVAARVAHSTGGQLLGITMLGLSQAIYGQRNDKPAIVLEASSEPEEDDVVTVHLDFDHPEQSVAIIRPGSPPAEG